EGVVRFILRAAVLGARVFFFQAEDGIRDFHVTGVQTCALPISRTRPLSGYWHPRQTQNLYSLSRLRSAGLPHTRWKPGAVPRSRSEERRVGKECGARRTPEH